ncbi:MAG: hypothetical protein ACR2RF_31715 [Geminicoccaceae bacterium]
MHWPLVTADDRVRTFKRSSDPEFIAKLEDIIGLSMAAPISTKRSASGSLVTLDGRSTSRRRHPDHAVETFFSALTRRRLGLGVFPAIVDLQTTINRYLDEQNQAPKPFAWTRPAEKIIEKLKQVKASRH